MVEISNNRKHQRTCSPFRCTSISCFAANFCVRDAYLHVREDPAGSIYYFSNRTVTILFITHSGPAAVKEKGDDTCKEKKLSVPGNFKYSVG